ncbi:MAG: hypothetical protein WDM81_09335 [Rhizomicrobium sp.]
MGKALLTISSKNYSSWSLRGWLLCRMAGLEFDEKVLSTDDPDTRAELLLLSPSFLVLALPMATSRFGTRWPLRNISRRRAPRAACCPRT